MWQRTKPTLPLARSVGPLLLALLIAVPAWAPPAPGPRLGYRDAADLGCLDREAPRWGLDAIRAREAQAITPGSPGVVVAVVDSGVDYTHPDLAGRLILGPNFVAPRGDDPYDTLGHGTFVASIVASVAPGARILAIRAGDNRGPLLRDSVAAIRYAVDSGASVVNISFGGASPQPAFGDVLDYAAARDVVVVLAAGNDGSASASAASYPQAMRVTATAPGDRLPGFANYGPWVDVAAPGTGIYGALPGNQHGVCDGTSFAAPFAAGVAALVRSAEPALSARAVIARVDATADDINRANPGFGGTLTFGRLNAYRALTGAAPPAVAAPVASPTPAPGTPAGPAAPPSSPTPAPITISAGGTSGPGDLAGAAGGSAAGALSGLGGR
jgi:subtilisin family serine protease